MTSELSYLTVHRNNRRRATNLETPVCSSLQTAAESSPNWKGREVGQSMHRFILTFTCSSKPLPKISTEWKL